MIPEIILGPPGTGKTTALLNVVDEEISQGVPPAKIGFLSFTRRAGEEAITRAAKRFNLPKSAFPYFRTIHSLCYRQLGMRKGDVLEGRKLQEFADWISIRITGRISEDGLWTGFETGDRAMFMENLSRTRRVPLRALYDAGDDFLPWNEVDRIARGLKTFKEDRGLLDFTDMLSQFLKVGTIPKLDLLIVDEVQDLTKLQLEVVRHIAKGVKRFVVAGDDDQAIFAWAGADSKHLVDMEGSTRVLGQSYRVPELIQRISGNIIEKITHRRSKTWKHRPSKGQVRFSPTFEEVDVSTGETLILARNSYILREQVEPELRRAGIIYERNGVSSVVPRILEAIIAWEKLRAGGQVAITEARNIYSWMNADISVAKGRKYLKGREDNELVDIEELVSSFGLLTKDIWHKALDKLPPDEMSYILAARRRGEKVLGTPRVRISTIHGSKGGEAEHVVLMKEMAKRTFKEMEIDEDNERRTWYVGVTRAKERLTIVESSTPQACPWL